MAASDGILYRSAMTRLGSDLCICTTLFCRTLTRYELALRSEEAEKPTDWGIFLRSEAFSCTDALAPEAR